VGIILSELIISFFQLFFKDEKRRQKHAEFRNELCVFLFALSIGRFSRMHKNILMRICFSLSFFCCIAPPKKISPENPYGIKDFGDF